MKVIVDPVATIAELPFVEIVGEDGERNETPIDTAPLADFCRGFVTWNLDVIYSRIQAYMIHGESTSRKKESQ